MHKLSKTTHNKAQRNGLQLTGYRVTDTLLGVSYETVEIAPIGACEFIAAYRVNEDGSYTFDASCGHRGNSPSHLRSEQHLRDWLPGWRV
jgi:hypothetical protein